MAKVLQYNGLVNALIFCYNSVVQNWVSGCLLLSKYSFIIGNWDCLGVLKTIGGVRSPTMYITMKGDQQLFDPTLFGHICLN